jgi:hypothetical protein
MALTANKCQCGAITVSDDTFSNSMTKETYKKEFPEVPLEDQMFIHCDHCINHWGIDLCGCGSGEPVGKCEGHFHQCVNNIPAQEKCKQKEFVGWVT